MRKTKIICTMGPAVDSDEMIEALIKAGMDCARFNFFTWRSCRAEGTYKACPQDQCET